MEVMVLLKLEVDVELARQPGETDDDVRTKTRAFIGDAVAHIAANQVNKNSLSWSVRLLLPKYRILGLYKLNYRTRYSK